MKFSVAQSALLEQLSVAVRISPNRATLVALTTTKLSAQNNLLTLQATDLSFGVKSEIAIEGEEDGACCVVTKQLYALVASLPSGTIFIERKKEGLLVTTEKGDVKTTLQYSEPEEFPDFPSGSGMEITIPAQLITDIATLLLVSAAKDLVRPALGCVALFPQDNGYELVSTDGFRLSLLHTTHSLGLEEQLLIPIKTITEMQRMLQSSEVSAIKVMVLKEQQSLIGIVGATHFFSKLVTAEFPPYTKILPPKFTTTVEFDKEQLEENVKRSLLFAQSDAAFIQFKILPDKLVVSTRNQANETLEATVVAVKKEGDCEEISFNSRYLLDYLKLCPDERVLLEMTETLKPARFSSVTYPNFYYVCMPYRVR